MTTFIPHQLLLSVSEQRPASTPVHENGERPNKMRHSRPAGLGFAAAAHAASPSEIARFGIGGYVAQNVATVAGESLRGRRVTLALGLFALLEASLAGAKGLRVAHAVAWRLPPVGLRRGSWLSAERQPVGSGAVGTAGRGPRGQVARMRAFCGANSSSVRMPRPLARCPRRRPSQQAADGHP